MTSFQQIEIYKDYKISKIIYTDTLIQIKLDYVNKDLQDILYDDLIPDLINIVGEYSKETKWLKLIAEYECCSRSIFGFLHFVDGKYIATDETILDKCIGKHLLEIKLVDIDIEQSVEDVRIILEGQHNREWFEVKFYELKFAEMVTSIILAVKNYSNGYYTGWLEITIEDKPEGEDEEDEEEGEEDDEEDEDGEV
jgi:hypothetical protein